MQLKLRYDIGNGPVEISTNLYVVVQWERRFKRKASDMADGIGIEDLAYMAWEASKLHSVVVPAEFDSFIKKLQGSIEVIGEDDENPIQEAPTDIL
jgi:hypothetical protein